WKPLGADVGDADLHADSGEMCRSRKSDTGRASGDHGDIVRRHGGMGHVKFPGRLGEGDLSASSYRIFSAYDQPARFFARPISDRKACNSLRAALAALRSILR